jgi:plasmid maintenance system antidote protein VapI
VSQEAEWITTEAAAEIMGVRPESVQRLCKNGGILCQKFGMVWQVWRKSAEEYVKSQGGRPKKDN